MCNYEFRICIDGLPKNFSIPKLTKILNRQTKSWKLEYLIPLEEYIVANIVCETKESYDCFLKIPETALFSSFPNIRVYNGVEQINTGYEANNNISKLNVECLQLIFAKCTLKEQIGLAKVCRAFHKAIITHFSKRYDILFFYNDLFKNDLKLTDQEIWEFSILCGPHVRTLEFTTIFSLQFAQQFIQRESRSVVEIGKRHINTWMCRHLVHFPQVRRFEVLGFFFDDFTVRELARYCPHLREFQLLDICNRFVSGIHFHLLRHLEVLKLPVCQNVLEIHMLKICRKLKLKTLHIVENINLIYAPFLKQIFALQYTSLKEVWLNAISNQSLLSTILDLPHLENLKFYWLDNYVSFEKMLFKELLRTRRKSLYALCWESEPPFMINETFVEWVDGEYERRREEALFSGKPWKCFEKYPEWINLLCGCTAIETMTFRYSRILTNEHILALPQICKSLENIQIVGCREEFDYDFLAKFIEQTRSDCQLSFQGLEWYEVKEVKDLSRVLQKEKQVLYRSILCNFK